MRKLPPLAQLRAFEAAARHLSFKQAAAELAVTPTAISHQIRLLEHYCGRALFRRRPRPVVLTPAGAQLFPVLRGGLDTFASAISALRTESARTTLKVTATNAFSSRWLLPRLQLWQQEHPETALEVIASDYVVDLHAGEADVAMRYAKKAPSDLVVHKLFRDKYVAVCSLALLSKHGAIKRARDLKRFVLIDNAWSSSFTDIPTWRRLLEKVRAIDPETPAINELQVMSFSEETHTIEAAISGQGIAICSDVLVARDIEAGRLKRVFIRSHLPGKVFFVAHLPHHPRRRAIDTFRRWIESARDVRPDW
jgi:LysR family transcriptional regulator, glycine cleavage system transcriptional activator